MPDTINIRALPEGALIALADGAMAEIVTNPNDGVWLFARYLESLTQHTIRRFRSACH